MPRRSPATSPRSPATSPAQYPAGSGVGVSVLLRQPHRFEGLSLVVVVRPFFDLAGPQRADEGIAAGKLNAASLALGTHQEEANHAVLARRAHLHVLQAPALPTLHPVANPLADTV